VAMLEFEGAAYLRQRLVMSVLSGKPIKISKIRALDDNPGLKDYEVNFLRLLEKVTNGTTIEVSYTGTAVVFKPGVIVGGRITHDCALSRAIGYYLEPMVLLAPFSKLFFVLTLNGITNDDTDISVDTIRTVLLPQLHKFGIQDDIELKITKRGAPPNGGGQVMFRCSTIRSLKPINLIDEGRIRRIRGIAYSTRVSPQTANRLVDSAKALLNKFIPDVFIYTDHYKGAESGNSPGYGISLVCESTTGCLFSSECYARAGETPEDLGRRGAKMLYMQIKYGGCVDSSCHLLNLLFVTLSSPDISKIRLGKLTPNVVQIFRDLQTFFGQVFKIETDASTKTILVSGIGVGYVNLNKKTT